MVAQVNLVDVASVLAQNDTAQKFQCSVSVSPENMKSTVDSLWTPMEWYQLKYDYYFDILLENSEQ